MIWTAFAAEVRREIIQIRRYPTEFLSELVVVTVIFYGLFLGGSYIAGHGILGSRLSDIIIGYGIWTLMLTAIGNMGWAISNEAQNGTLEQVCLAPVRIRTIFALRSSATLVQSILFTLIALFGIMLLTQHYIYFAWMEIPPALMAIAVSVGLGYLVASITILFKRSNQFLNLLQFALLFLIMTPFTDLPGAWKYLSIAVPAAPMMGILRHVAAGAGSFPAETTWLVFGCLNTLIWLVLGYVTYGVAHDRARSRGILGHY